MMPRRLFTVAVVLVALPALLIIPMPLPLRLGGLALWIACLVVDYRAFAGRTNASAPWAWMVTRLLEATRASLDEEAVDIDRLRPHARADARFLDGAAIAARAGERPEMVRGVPHRQLTQHPPAALRASMRERLAALADFADGNFADGATHALSFRPSLWELTGAEALIVKTCATCSPELVRAKGEVAHLHSYDGSLHAILSPADAMLVIERGWGELFAVAGALGGRVPWIVLVYAPRTAAESETVISILRASYRYATRTVEARS